MSEGLIGVIAGITGNSRRPKLRSPVAGAEAAVKHKPWLPACESISQARNAIITVLLMMLVSGVAFGQARQSAAPETVVIPSGVLKLKAFLWKPAGQGPFPAVLFNHGRSDDPQHQTRDRTITATARILGPVFAKHGYVFLHPFRRGEGLSAGQGSFIGDLLQREELARGEEARKHLQFVLLTTDHLDDGMASLFYLKSLPEVDSHRVAVAGHSFGGQITLLEAEQDPAVRAVVIFGAAAHSWSGSEEIRASMLAAAAKIRVPILILHAANDYSVAPGQALDGELARLGKPHLLKIYPPVGESANAGHNFLYTNISLWEDDVFRFLDDAPATTPVRISLRP
ncbi:MAG: alpha/beta hydrolase family protein [Steroidobacterales bacterium]